MVFLTVIVTNSFLCIEILLYSPWLVHRCNNFATTTELGVQIKVVVNDGEPIESALRRFKREINKSGHLMELRHRRYFENSQQKVIRKVKEGRLRKKFERMQRRRMQQRV